MPTATLIIAAQPTRGLDVGATAFVWRSLREARARGCGILLISSDLDELFDISDRVVVMLSGRIVGEFRPPYRLGDVGAAMTGARAMTAGSSQVVRALAFVLLALVLCGIIFEFAGYSAPLMFQSIAEGAFLNPARAWQNSLRWALPLFITATGVVISFRCGYLQCRRAGPVLHGRDRRDLRRRRHERLLRRSLVIPLTFLAGIVGGGAVGAVAGHPPVQVRAPTRSSPR